MKTLLIVLGSLCAFAAALPYIIDTLHGKTKPRIVSWLIWTALTAIGTAASLSQHQYPAAAFTAAIGFQNLIISILGFQHGDKRFEWLDAVCFIGAGLGLAGLLLLKSPSLALALTIATDVVGGLPTIKHAWVQPGEETFATYYLEATGSIFILLAANFAVFTAYGYPMYLITFNLLMVAIIIARAGHTASVRHSVPAAAAAALPIPGADSATTGIPTVPTGLVAPSPSHLPALAWAPVPGATQYHVYRDGAEIAASPVAGFTDSDATDNLHTYAVTAASVAGESGRSNPVRVQVDHTPPAIAYHLSRQPNQHGWYNAPVTVTFAAADAKAGIASCSQPVTLSQDGIAQTITGYAMNYAGDSASVPVTLNIDQTPPQLGEIVWSLNPTLRGRQVTMTVSVRDPLSGVEQGEYIGYADPGPGQGIPMVLSDGALTIALDTNLEAGQYPMAVRAKDTAGNWSELKHTVLTVVDSTRSDRSP
jgi:hypothetical protein